MPGRLAVLRGDRQLFLHVDDHGQLPGRRLGVREHERLSAQHQQPGRDGLPAQHLVSCDCSQGRMEV